MTDDPFLIAVRVEKRLVRMAPIIAAVSEALSNARMRLDVKEVMPLYLGKHELIDRARSVLHGVVETAKTEREAILSVHVALSRSMYVLSGQPPREIELAIIATAGPFSPVSFSLATDPSTVIPKAVTHGLNKVMLQIYKEMPKFPSVNDPDGVELSRTVITALVVNLFRYKGLTEADDGTVLQ